MTERHVAFDVPQAELERRWSVLQRYMQNRGIDALVITAEKNFEYVTGLRTPAWMIKARPMAVVVPSGGTPIPVAPAGVAADIAATGIFAGLRVYRGFESTAVDALLQVIEEEGLSRSRIGVELGREQRLGLPVAEYRRLVDAIPAAEFTDGGEVLWSARMVKSDFELERLRKAGSITGEVYDALLAEIDDTWTERMVYAEFAAESIRRGADSAGYVTIIGGRGHYDLQSSRARDRRIERGELFWMDGGCVYRSYFSDYTRCAAIGKATSKQSDVYSRLLATLVEMASAVRPGEPASAILMAAVKAAQQSGLDLVIPTRVGHGIGLDVTEPPSLAADDSTTLAAGMALAVEVGVMSDQGWFHLEENMSVTNQGAEFISARTPVELPVLAGAAARAPGSGEPDGDRG